MAWDVASLLLLPFQVAERSCVTIVSPKGEDFTGQVSDMFDLLGGSVVARDDDECAILQATTCLMGPFYRMQQECMSWLKDKGINQKIGSKYLAGMFLGIARDSQTYYCAQQQLATSESYINKETNYYMRRVRIPGRIEIFRAPQQRRIRS
eukprot:jgi/Bigna1/79602/fgenesh1_pg.63_\